jgi:hypothetical protein
MTLTITTLDLYAVSYYSGRHLCWASQISRLFWVSLCWMSLCIMTFSIMAPRIMDFIVTLTINDSQHNDSQHEHQVSLCWEQHYLVSWNWMSLWQMSLYWVSWRPSRQFFSSSFLHKDKKERGTATATSSLHVRVGRFVNEFVFVSVNQRVCLVLLIWYDTLLKFIVI